MAVFAYSCGADKLDRKRLTEYRPASMSTVRSTGSSWQSNSFPLICLAFFVLFAPHLWYPNRAMRAQNQSGTLSRSCRAQPKCFPALCRCAQNLSSEANAGAISNKLKTAEN